MPSNPAVNTPVALGAVRTPNSIGPTISTHRQGKKARTGRAEQYKRSREKQQGFCYTTKHNHNTTYFPQPPETWA